MRSSLRKSTSLLRRLLPRLGIAFIVTVVFYVLNIASLMSKVIDPVLNIVGLSSMSVIVITTTSMQYISGLYIAASLYMQGYLTVKELILSMLVGSLFHSVIVHIRSYLPLRSVFFGLDVALRWTLFDLATTIVTMLVVIVAVLYLL